MLFNMRKHTSNSCPSCNEDDFLVLVEPPMNAIRSFQE
jgi:hypothetical protein